jgi:hypothetical protein
MSLSQTRLINTTPVINNRRTLGARPLIRRRRRQFRRQRRMHQRTFQLNVPISNEDTLKCIAKLPLQVIDDPLLHQFFNGYQLI